MSIMQFLINELIINMTQQLKKQRHTLCKIFIYIDGNDYLA